MITTRLFAFSSRNCSDLGCKPNVQKQLSRNCRNTHMQAIILLSRKLSTMPQHALSITSSHYLRSTLSQSYRAFPHQIQRRKTLAQFESVQADSTILWISEYFSWRKGINSDSAVWWKGEWKGRSRSCSSLIINDWSRWRWRWYGKGVFGWG